MGRVDVVGEIVVDLVETGDGRLRPVPGGSPANVALAAARLGTSASLRARIGADALGRRCRDHLRSNGVDLSRAVAAREPATLALATIGDDGAAHYDFWATGTSDWQWRDDELADLGSDDAVGVHTGSLASWTPPGRSAVLAAVQRVHAEGRATVSYDPNIRPSLMGDRTAALALVESYIAASHVVKASDEDVAWLYPGMDLDEVTARWLDLGATLAVVTRGGSGATAVRAGAAPLEVTAPEVHVVDTVGAGDTFTGALLHALEHRGLLGDAPAARLATLDPDTLAAVVTWAATAAAVTCSREGCDPPAPTDVVALLPAR